jgi:hypothetical protein
LRSISSMEIRLTEEGEEKINKAKKKKIKLDIDSSIGMPYDEKNLGISIKEQAGAFVNSDQKALDIYERFVQYEWKEVSDGLRDSILRAIKKAFKQF